MRVIKGRHLWLYIVIYIYQFFYSKTVKIVFEILKSITEDTMSIFCPFTASLPVEILFEIFVYVGERDLENVAATCRLMNKLVSYNEVWRQLFQIHFPELAIPTAVLDQRTF